ncbi:MAG: hypothetical protein JW757_02445 [Anaerolineales bacterium]|nr:hypothetical protein [Anaerolineales bacterium]
MDAEHNQLPSIKSYLPLIVVLLFIGFGGLFLLFNLTEPTLWPRWLFFFMVVLGVTGLAMPVVLFIYHRFPTGHTPSQRVILRQSLWAGIYAAFMIWLSLGQVFKLGVAAIVFVGIVLLEIVLRFGERSFWRRP